MNTPKAGNDVEHLDIAGTEQVKESYRAALQEEPRAIIDDAIRAAARRAVSAGPTSVGKTWVNRWTTPLAAAATVVLTSSVIFMAMRDQPEVAPPIANTVVLPEAVKIAPAETTKDVVAAAPVLESGATDKRAYATAPASASATQMLPLNQAKEKKSSAAESTTAPAMAHMQESSNRVMQLPPAPSEVIASQKKIPPASAKQIAQPVELAKATPVTPPAAPSIAAPKVMNEIKAEAASDANTQNTSRRKQTDSEATVALTAEATGKLAAPAPAPEPVMPRADMSPAASPVAAAPAPAPPPAADSMEKSPTVSQRAISFTSEKSDKIESAEAWIKRMTELKRQEKSKELAEEIARFRKRYPSVELPKELTEP